MSDRIQELRAEAQERPDSCEAAFALTEALDGWEKANEKRAMLLKANEEQVRLVRAAEADRDTYRAAWNRAEAQLTRLREAAGAVVDDASRVGNGTYREVRGELIDALDAALTQENPDE